MTGPTIAGDRARLLEAILPHVTFDGWTDAALRAAAADAGIAPDLLPVILPRGALDLAVDYHRRGDRAMEAALAAEDMGGLKFRERVARAVQLRLQGADREVVRRGAALFALPQHAGVGSGLIWGTADAIWRALGDTSEGIAHYTKRASLSAVYGATVLYWLGDESAGAADSWAFLDRRIAEVMRFEKLKADFRGSFAGRLLAPSSRALDRLVARTGGAA
jgi:ubiquinone biosynthesis protein COQ9